MSKTAMKFLGLFLAVTALNPVSLRKINAGYVIDYTDERKAAESQKRILDGVNKRRNEGRLEKIQSLIIQNENEIKRLEKNKREKLDHELAVLLQNREDLEYRLKRTSWLNFLECDKIKSDLSKVDCKIRRVRDYINENERKIRELKNKRTQLDHEYAVILANTEER